MSYSGSPPAWAASLLGEVEDLRREVSAVTASWIKFSLCCKESEVRIKLIWGVLSFLRPQIKPGFRHPVKPVSAELLDQQGFNFLSLLLKG